MVFSSGSVGVTLATGDYNCRAEDTETLSQMYFERWGLLAPPYERQPLAFPMTRV